MYNWVLEQRWFNDWFAVLEIWSIHCRPVTTLSDWGEGIYNGLRIHWTTVMVYWGKIIFSFSSIFLFSHSHIISATAPIYRTTFELDLIAAGQYLLYLALWVRWLCAELDTEREQTRTSPSQRGERDVKIHAISWLFSTLYMLQLTLFVSMVLFMLPFRTVVLILITMEASKQWVLALEGLKMDIDKSLMARESGSACRWGWAWKFQRLPTLVSIQ